MIRYVSIAIISVAVSGCASEPTRDPQFAEVRPRMAKPVPLSRGSIFQAGNELLLFEDQRAKQVGDVLTVQLVESTDASKSADTDLEKNASATITNPTVLSSSPQFGLPGFVPLATRTDLNLSSSLSADNDFNGDAQSSQSNSLRGSISVTVAEVLPNGNLVVQGEKLMSLNQGHEHIRISGVVRRADIGPNNTVDSTRIANARIVYGGEGPLAAANRIGWLARFFVSALFPF
ncbi:MAG: flagellar basal body L-ring protein FlgH [Pseudomonadota bacterium]